MSKELSMQRRAIRLTVALLMLAVSAIGTILSAPAAEAARKPATLAVKGWSDYPITVYAKAQCTGNQETVTKGHRSTLEDVRSYRVPRDAAHAIAWVYVDGTYIGAYAKRPGQCIVAWGNSDYVVGAFKTWNV